MEKLKPSMKEIAQNISRVAKKALPISAIPGAVLAPHLQLNALEAVLRDSESSRQGPASMIDKVYAYDPECNVKLTFPTVPTDEVLRVTVKSADGTWQTGPVDIKTRGSIELLKHPSNYTDSSTKRDFLRFTLSGEKYRNGVKLGSLSNANYQAGCDSQWDVPVSNPEKEATSKDTTTPTKTSSENINQEAKMNQINIDTDDVKVRALAAVAILALGVLAGFGVGRRRGPDGGPTLQQLQQEQQARQSAEQARTAAVAQVTQLQQQLQNLPNQLQQEQQARQSAEQARTAAVAQVTQLQQQLNNLPNANQLQQITQQAQQEHQQRLQAEAEAQLRQTQLTQAPANIAGRAQNKLLMQAVVNQGNINVQQASQALQEALQEWQQSL